MTSDLKLRISLALFVSIFLAVSIYMQHRENAVTDGSSYSNPYFPIISGTCTCYVCNLAGKIRHSNSL